MDVVVTGRGTRVTDRIRGFAEHKLAHLERIEPRAVRIEVQVVAEPNARRTLARRVDAALATPRKTFRAHARAEDVESALDRLADKLERQLRDHHGKRRARQGAGVKGVASAGPEGQPEPEADERD
jgi:putative sigma-54 modulation protein